MDCKFLCIIGLLFFIIFLLFIFSNNCAPIINNYYGSVYQLGDINGIGNAFGDSSTITNG